MRASKRERPNLQAALIAAQALAASVVLEHVGHPMLIAVDLAGRFPAVVDVPLGVVGTHTQSCQPKNRRPQRGADLRGRDLEIVWRSRRQAFDASELTRPALGKPDA